MQDIDSVRRNQQTQDIDSAQRSQWMQEINSAQRNQWMQEALPISYPARGPGQYCRLWTRPADIRHPSQGGKTNYPGRGIDRKKPLYRPQWLSTAAYKGFGLQLLTTIYSGSVSQFSLLKAVLCFFLPALTQRFTYSECIVRNISHILNTPLHAFRIQHLTCSVYIDSRIPNTTSHVFRIHHFMCSVYIISRIPNTTSHTFRTHCSHHFTHSLYFCILKCIVLQYLLFCTGGKK